MNDQGTLKDLIASNGMTQKEFSERFGIPIRTVQDWARSKRKPPDYVVELIKYRIAHENGKDKDGKV